MQTRTRTHGLDPARAPGARTAPASTRPPQASAAASSRSRAPRCAPCAAIGLTRPAPVRSCCAAGQRAAGLAGCALRGALASILRHRERCSAYGRLSARPAPSAAPADGRASAAQAPWPQQRLEPALRSAARQPPLAAQGARSAATPRRVVLPRAQHARHCPARRRESGAARGVRGTPPARCCSLHWHHRTARPLMVARCGPRRVSTTAPAPRCQPYDACAARRTASATARSSGTTTRRRRSPTAQPRSRPSGGRRRPPTVRLRPRAMATVSRGPLTAPSARTSSQRSARPPRTRS